MEGGAKRTHPDGTASRPKTLALRRSARLAEGRAAGSIFEQYFDMSGRLVPSHWNQNCVAIPLAEAKKNPMAIGVALGEEKVPPILGALHGGLLDCVITNVTTASRVLEEQHHLAISNGTDAG